MALIRRVRPSDREKTLACAEFFFRVTTGDSSQLEEAGVRLRQALGQGWAFPQVVQFFAGKRCAQVIETMSKSEPETPERIVRDALLLQVRLAACEIMSQWQFPAGMSPTEAEIERALDIFRRIRQMFPETAAIAESPAAVPPIPLAPLP
ncbi:MAG: hypothetical protein ACK5TK_03260 [Betaproteobacteria bacterium]